MSTTAGIIIWCIGLLVFLMLAVIFAVLACKSILMGNVPALVVTTNLCIFCLGGVVFCFLAVLSIKEEQDITSSIVEGDGINEDGRTVTVDPEDLELLSNQAGEGESVDEEDMEMDINGTLCIVPAMYL